MDVTHDRRTVRRILAVFGEVSNPSHPVGIIVLRPCFRLVSAPNLHLKPWSARLVHGSLTRTLTYRQCLEVALDGHAVGWTCCICAAGDAMPLIRFLDISNTRELSLNDEVFHDKVVVVDFWATWSGKPATEHYCVMVFYSS